MPSAGSNTGAVRPEVEGTSLPSIQCEMTIVVVVLSAMLIIISVSRQPF